MTDAIYQKALAVALGSPENDAGIVGEPMIAAVAHASRVEHLESEKERLVEELQDAQSRGIPLSHEVQMLRAALKEIIEIDHYPDATIARKALNQ